MDALVGLLSDAAPPVRSRAAEVLWGWGGGGVRAILGLLFKGDLTPVIECIEDTNVQTNTPSDKVAGILARVLAPHKGDSHAVRQAREVVYNWVWQRWGDVT